MTATATETCGELVAGEPCQLLKNHAVPCSPTGDFYVPFPDEDFSQIAPRLWMGSSVGEQPSPEQFDSVLTLYRSAPWSEPPIQERRFHFDDGRQIPELQALHDAVDWVYGQWAGQKKEVLVRCQAGLNRSGLIVALVLMRDGLDADLAIAAVRERRSPYALCNPAFETYLRGCE